jgi:TsgA-like MFS transporter
MLIVYTLILLSLLSLNFVSDLTMIGVALSIVGICSGLGLVGAALVISRKYDAERRASMLVITDGSFSVAGFVCAGIATFLVARAFHWAGVYQFVALVAAAILLLIIVSRFPATTIAEQNSAGKHRWPLSIWCCLGALFLYTLGQYSMLWWLPNYAETKLGVSRAEAGRLVSLFWFGMFAAQLFVAWWVTRVGVRKLVLIAGVLTSIFSIPLWIYEDIAGLSVLAFLWGVANLSLLKIVLSFATQMLPVPSGRLVSSLLLGATVGTALSPWVTSQIVVVTDNHFILQFSTACYVTLTGLLFVATRLFRS